MSETTKERLARATRREAAELERKQQAEQRVVDEVARRKAMAEKILRLRAQREARDSSGNEPTPPGEAPKPKKKLRRA
jgi:hypothetical protein